MKTERRHELETNTLAKELDVWGEKLRPYSSLMLGGVAALLAAYVIMSIWSSYGAARDRAAWDEYQMAILSGESDMKQLQAAAASEENVGALTMQDWAYVGWADRQLLIAANEYLTDKTGAEKRLSAIAAVYEQFSESATDPEVRNRARLGMARVDELQNRPEDARKHYALVQGALSTVAQVRIKELEQKSVQEDEAWLATAKAPAARMPSGAGTPGAKPNFGAAPPTADSPPAGFDSSQSLEEILGGLTKGKADEEPARYDGKEPPAGEAASAAGSPPPPTDTPPTTDTPSTTDAPPSTDTPATASEAPADVAAPPQGESTPPAKQ